MRVIVEDIVTDLLREIEQVKVENRTPKEIVLTALEFEELLQAVREREERVPVLGSGDRIRFSGIPVRVVK